MNISRLTICLLMLITTTGAWAQQRHSDTMDDMLEHLPLATNLVLKLCGAESATENNWQYCTQVLGSYAVAAGITYGLKHSIHEWRPDHSDNKSFPSGHATFAFAGAHALHKEYHWLSPWISVGGYTVATFVAVDRVLRDRHHWYDVCTGAAIGVVTTELVYLASDRLFPKAHTTMAWAGNQLSMSIRF